jgi:hypothetical protein
MLWGDRQPDPIPDFDNGLVLNVSDAARDLIEAFEPNVHQFLPVDYFDRDGVLLERRNFLIVGNRLDSLDRAHETMVFSSERIGDAHLWRDKHLRGGPFLSDALAAAIEALGLTGLRLSESRARMV